MSYRKTVFANDEIYHVFNRSVARQSVITYKKDIERFLELTDYYRFKNPFFRFSHYNRLLLDKKLCYLKSLYEMGKGIVEIYAFAFMPNHFHFLLKQLEESGISTYISHIQNSFAKYFNAKTDRQGSLWQEMFKAQRIETNEQFVHVARYIHLNPLTSYLIKNSSQLEWDNRTSFMDYLGKRNLPFLNKTILMNYFPNLLKLKQFTLNNVEYQRTLNSIKHLVEF